MILIARSLILTSTVIIFILQQVTDLDAEDEPVGTKHPLAVETVSALVLKVQVTGHAVGVHEVPGLLQCPLVQQAVAR